MRKASVRELHINTSKLVREAAEGSAIMIESRGKPVAELRPPGSAKRYPAPEEKERMFAEMEKLWARMPQMPDSAEIILEDRDRF